MSSYWGATSGMALCLNSQEADAFLAQYLKETYRPNATQDEIEKFKELVTDLNEEMIFISSKNKIETIKKMPALKCIINSMENDDYCVTNITKAIKEATKLPVSDTFDIAIYSDDPYSGGYLCKTTKYYNKDIEEEVYESDSINDGIIIYTQKSVLPQSILNGESYKSMDEIFDEFKYRLKDYLPADFNWASHIGFFECAVFA